MNMGIEDVIEWENTNEENKWEKKEWVVDYNIIDSLNTIFALKKISIKIGEWINLGNIEDNFSTLKTFSFWNELIVWFHEMEQQKDSTTLENLLRSNCKRLTWLLTEIELMWFETFKKKWVDPDNRSIRFTLIGAMEPVYWIEMYDNKEFEELLRSFVS